VPPFVPGRDLAAGFYHDVVAGIVGGRPHSAGFIGWGSDVLGFDSARSTDHGFGPRLQVFVAAAEVEALAADLDDRLPDRYRDWPVRFGWDEWPVTHHVEVATIDHWIDSYLAIDCSRPLKDEDWLLMPQQRLLTVTEGPVFSDGLGRLEPLREQLRWYPDPVWLFVLASQWQRVSQEEAFVGRAAEAGDEIGSRLVAGRIARDLIRMCFLIERRYAPYSKWLGTAFGQLAAAAEIGPALEAALAPIYSEREVGLGRAYEAVARRFNGLGLTKPVEPTLRTFYRRPYLVLHADRFVAACRQSLAGSVWADRPLVGAVDQFVDSTDALAPRRARRLAAVYEEDG
jgi:hypothetical protein